MGASMWIHYLILNLQVLFSQNIFNTQKKLKMYGDMKENRCERSSFQIICCRMFMFAYIVLAPSEKYRDLFVYFV